MDKADDEPQNDLALVLDKADASDGYRVLRRRAADSSVELGTIRPLKEGRPIEGEVVSLQPREDVPFLYDVKTELADPRARGAPPDQRWPSADRHRGVPARLGSHLGPGDGEARPRTDA